jgi:hypothetical protein
MTKMKRLQGLMHLLAYVCWVFGGIFYTVSRGLLRASRDQCPQC